MTCGDAKALMPKSCTSLLQVSYRPWQRLRSGALAKPAHSCVLLLEPFSNWLRNSKSGIDAYLSDVDPEHTLKSKVQVFHQQQYLHAQSLQHNFKQRC